jgi:hypothetical protein
MSGAGCNIIGAIRDRLNSTIAGIKVLVIIKI